MLKLAFKSPADVEPYALCNAFFVRIPGAEYIYIYIRDPTALGSSIGWLCKMKRKHAELFVSKASLQIPLVKLQFNNQRG